MTEYGERYGRRRDPFGSHPRRWIIALIALIVGVIGFWAATSLTPQANLQTATVRFEVPDSNRATIDARIVVAPGTPLACAFQASNASSTIVGYQVIQLPASEEPSRVVAAELRTTQAATLAEVKECWVIGSGS